MLSKNVVREAVLSSQEVVKKLLANEIEVEVAKQAIRGNSLAVQAFTADVGQQRVKVEAEKNRVKLGETLFSDGPALKVAA